jgi:hypothetical protein
MILFFPPFLILYWLYCDVHGWMFCNLSVDPLWKLSIVIIDNTENVSFKNLPYNNWIWSTIWSVRWSEIWDMIRILLILYLSGFRSVLNIGFSSLGIHLFACLSFCDSGWHRFHWSIRQLSDLFPMIKEIFCSNEIHRDLRVLNSDVCSLLGWLLKLPLIFGSPVELSVLSFLFALFFFVRLLY